MSTPFRHIVVTLDGSTLSEVALPVALELTRVSGADLTLLHVVEPDAPATVHGERHLQTESEATEYLESLVLGLQQQGIVVRAEVAVAAASGQVPETIAERSSILEADLLVLASHGEGGIRELLFGRVAQRIIRRSTDPLVLVPANRGSRPFTLQSLLLPLDGSSDAEIVLPFAIAFAQNAGSAITLVRVVPTPGDLQGTQAAVRTFLPGATARVLSFEVEEATEYLDEIAATKLSSLPVTLDLRRGAVDSEIRKALVQHNADLLMMCTHGHSGLTALLEGSLGAQLLSASPCPIFLVRFRPA